MCCFSGDVKVTGTQIFARLSGRGTQYLVYQMQYEAREPVAMILPLPVALPAQQNAVRFLDLQHFPEFFLYLHNIFAVAASAVSTLSENEDTALLDVHEVGDFVASFVPSQRDFSRLNPRFVLPDDVWAQLPLYQDYGFAVFQLKELAGEPHPIAFEFATRLPETLFFPTVHIHDGQVNEAEQFEHVLFFQGAVSQGESTYGNLGDYMGFEFAGEILDPESPARVFELYGLLPNRDTLIPLEN